MEATAVSQSTGSKTIADLLPRAAEKYASQPAVRFKRDGEWQDVTYAQLGEIVSEIGRGLIDLGIEPQERVCILANTRPEWSYCDFAISATGATVVPIYQTNSPSECEWVATPRRWPSSARTPPSWPRSWRSATGSRTCGRWW